MEVRKQGITVYYFIEPEVFKLWERKRMCVSVFGDLVCLCMRECVFVSACQRERAVFCCFLAPRCSTPFMTTRPVLVIPTKKKILKLVSFSLSLSLSFCECQQRNGSKLISVQMVIKLYFVPKNVKCCTWKINRKGKHRLASWNRESKWKFKEHKGTLNEKANVLLRHKKKLDILS